MDQDERRPAAFFLVMDPDAANVRKVAVFGMGNFVIRLPATPVAPPLKPENVKRRA